MQKAPSVLFIVIGLLVLIAAAVSVSFYTAHLQAVNPDSSEIKSMVISYYDQKGEWAGQYVIQQIDQVRSISQNDTQSILCVTYQYAYPSQPKQSQGMDRRTFLLQYIQDSWQVTKMGGHLSC
jgi:hypothetical protein